MAKYSVDGAPGWTDLVKPIVEEIQSYNKEYPDNQIEILQIKEKFGGLRFYIGNTRPQYIIDMIRKAEEESYHICQDCGKPGERCTIHNWIYTFCPECKKKLEDKFASYHNS